MTGCEKCDASDMNVKYGDLKKQDRPRGCFCKHPLFSQKHKMSDHISLIVASKKLQKSKTRKIWWENIIKVAPTLIGFVSKSFTSSL